MTPALWLILYVSIVLVLGAIAIGWTDGVWRRHQDARDAWLDWRIAQYYADWAWPRPRHGLKSDR